MSKGESNKIERIVKNKTAKGRLKNPEEYEFLLKLCALISTKNRRRF